MRRKKRLLPQFAVGQVIFIEDDDVYAKIREVKFYPDEDGGAWGYLLDGEVGITHFTDLRALTAKEKG
jgi:hypothetical protein